MFNGSNNVASTSECLDYTVLVLHVLVVVLLALSSPHTHHYSSVPQGGDCPGRAAMLYAHMSLRERSEKTLCTVQGRLLRPVINVGLGPLAAIITEAPDNVNVQNNLVSSSSSTLGTELNSNVLYTVRHCSTQIHYIYQPPRQTDPSNQTRFRGETLAAVAVRVS